jgi:hypothetical protein
MEVREEDVDGAGRLWTFCYGGAQRTDTAACIGDQYFIVV